MQNIKLYAAAENLTRQFQELKTMEEDSAKLYTALLTDVSDPSDQTVLKQIIVDEYKHTKMAQNIIEILQS
ncbi:MAG TPA: hypothetical protein VJB62_04115 [Patescibacteria group bacterium]|jgi:rubrerythrin|nr:hypothetical protein [Patescibacteria group bacterium]